MCSLVPRPPTPIFVYMYPLRYMDHVSVYTMLVVDIYHIYM